MSATTTRRDVLRRVAVRSVALLAAASLATACANPTGPSDLNNPSAHASVTSSAQDGNGVGGGSNNHATMQSGVGGGSNNHATAQSGVGGGSNN